VFRELHEPPRFLHVANHQGEWLFLAVLAGAKRGDRALVVRSAGEMEAPDSLHRDDQAVGKRLRRGPGSIAAAAFRLDARRLYEPQPRPAVRTGDRLGVEAAIARVLVFGPAAFAHLEAGHRGERAVIWDAAHDREAGAAVGAVHEWMAEAPAPRIEQLGEAVGTSCGVRRHQRVRLA
jgi:hypothetical protein